MGGTTAVRGAALGRGDIVLHVVVTDALADPIGTLGPDSSKICPKLGRRGPHTPVIIGCHHWITTCREVVSFGRAAPFRQGEVQEGSVRAACGHSDK